MRWSEVSESLCPIARTAAIIGDRWTLLILREALQGVRSFDGLEKALGVSPHILSVRLKRLVAEDILKKDERGHYRLTSSGIALQPVVLGIAAWGNRWRGDGDGPQSEFIHHNCGHVFDPILTCSACDGPVEPSAVETRFSPALSAERAVRR